MSGTLSICLRRSRWLKGFIALLSLSWAALAVGQEARQVVRVEEDWELVLGTPDPNTNSPQVTCVMSPSATLDSLHVSLDINHQKLPAYSPGGLQLQIRNGEDLLSYCSSVRTEVLATPGDTVRWTMSMAVGEGRLVFQLANGSSATWGNFGGTGYLKTAAATTLGNLNQYNPDTSIRGSAVTFASNRVAALRILRVRYVLSTGEVYEDNTVRNVSVQN